MNNYSINFHSMYTFKQLVSVSPLKHCVTFSFAVPRCSASLPLPPHPNPPQTLSIWITSIGCISPGLWVGFRIQGPRSWEGGYWSKCIYNLNSLPVGFASGWWHPCRKRHRSCATEGLVHITTLSGFHSYSLLLSYSVWLYSMLASKLWLIHYWSPKFQPHLLK